MFYELDLERGKEMKKLLVLLIGLVAGIFVIGGAFTLIGALLGLTFGIIGSAIGAVFKIMFTPGVLVLIIIILAYKLNKKSA